MTTMLALIAAAAVSGSGPIDVGPATAQIKAACGVDLKIEIDKASFENEAEALRVLRMSHLTFLGDAFAKVCAEGDLKAEVGKQISSVVFAQAYGAPDPMVYIMKRSLHVEYYWVKGEPPPDAGILAGGIAARLRGEEPEEP